MQFNDLKSDKIVALCLFALCMLCIMPHAASSQLKQSNGGIVVGITIDSIHGGVLRSAIVRIVGTPISTTSDTLGEFRLSGVPTGEYRLEVIHPLLDTLGVTLRTAARRSTGEDSIFLALSTPSPNTLVLLKCTVGEREQGNAMILGTVFDAETELPSEGARVSLEWTDYELGTGSLKRTPQTRTSSVKSDGSYSICGIPPDLETGIVASRGGDTTAVIPASFRRQVAIVSFHLSSWSSPSGGMTVSPGVAGEFSRKDEPRAIVSGRVVDGNGKPILGARVSTEDDLGVTTSGDNGEFSLGHLRPGTRSVVVRRIGFQPTNFPVEVQSHSPQFVEIVLVKFVPVLETVRITALRELGLERVGFASRKKSGTGRYFAPKDLENRNSPRLIDLLATVPSLRAGKTSEGQRYVTGRFGDCVRYFVDGKLWSEFGEGPDMYISGSEMGALEVYGAFSAPPEFMAFGRDGRTCSTVVVWTKWKLRIK